MGGQEFSKVHTRGTNALKTFSLLLEPPLLPSEEEDDCLIRCKDLRRLSRKYPLLEAHLVTHFQVLCQMNFRSHKFDPQIVTFRKSLAVQPRHFSKERQSLLVNRRQGLCLQF